jgi:polar amino acid transport system substrate-binding protein
VTLLGCDLPRDARGTLGRVEGGVLRAGVSGDGPWARAGEDGPPEGVEVALVERLAEQLRARVVWERGDQDDLLAALERGGLDLVVCGLTDDTPWAKSVALTRPYATARVVVAGPPAAAALDDLSGQDVEVDDPLHAALVEAKGGRPVPAGSGVAALRALPDWALDETDLVPSRVVLHEERHVLAAPPGETAWLVRLDRFLHEAESLVPRLLRGGAR